MRVEFTLKGEPQGKERPRFTSRGGYVRTYTSQKTTAYEQAIRQAYLGSTDMILEGPVRVTIRAYMGIPSSASKVKTQRMQGGQMRPTKKPDPDNIAKVILDGLNHLAYDDDKQVVDLVVEKWWSSEPRVEVEVEELEEDHVKQTKGRK